VSKRGWLLFIAMGLIWGIPYLLIKVSVEHLSPSVVIFIRVALAAAVLLPIVIVRKDLPKLAGHWRWVVAFALVEMTFTFLALTWAQERITSSLAGLMIAAVPLVAAVIAWRLGMDDRLHGGRLVGLGVGILGVGALVGLDVTGGTWLAIAALSITVLGYAIGPIIVARKLSNVPAMAVIAMALLINTVIYTPFAIVNWPTQTVPASAWWAVVALGLICTAVAFILFFALIAEVGPSRTTVITYINPAVAVVLGVVVLSEPITLGIAIGFPLVLLGSWLATRRAPVMETEPHM
jgi:drug/metabolite transporter (DMT)-like permease